MSSLVHHQATTAGSPFWRRPDALNWQDIENNVDNQQGRAANFQPFEWLFHAGEERTLCYRIEAGVVSLSIRAADGSLLGFRLAFPGELIGAGARSTHRSSGMALIATTVTCIPAGEVEELAKNDLELKALLDDANRREADDLPAAPQPAPREVARA